MKRQTLALILTLALTFSLFGYVSIVHAQTACTDATGAPIPCPPTEEPSTGGGDSEEQNEDSGGGAQPGGGNPNPATVVTATPEPTSTPLPIAQPEGDYLGSCTSENFTECKAQFECEDGLLVVKVDIYAGGGTKYDFYCYSHEETPLLDLPFAIPTPGGSDENWDGFCIVRPGQTLEDCSDLFKAACDADGGDYQEEPSEDGSSLFARCENQSEAVPPAPTEAPAIAAAPEDEGSSEGKGQECSWAGCWFDRVMCVVNGGYYNDTVDHKGVTTFTCTYYNEDGTPVEGGAPAPNWSPWVVVGGLAILIGLLLPAVQKIRDAAARIPQTKEHVLLNNDNGGTEAHDVFLDIGHPTGETSGRMPNNKNPELVKNKDDGEQGKSSVRRLFGDADGDTPPPPPPPPPAKK